jgi:hypothetical protein
MRLLEANRPLVGSIDVIVDEEVKSNWIVRDCRKRGLGDIYIKRPR